MTKLTHTSAAMKVHNECSYYAQRTELTIHTLIQDKKIFEQMCKYHNFFTLAYSYASLGGAHSMWSICQ